MLQDLEVGRRTEIDAINGILSKTGRRFGIPTPVSNRVVEIIKGIEAGRYEPDMKNLDMFTEF